MASVSDLLSHSRALRVLLGLNCGMFLLLTLFDILWRTGATDANLLLFQVVLPGSAQGWIHRPWTLLTYMISQTGFLHLLFNMLWLLWFGRLSGLNSRQLYTVYVLGGIAGALFFLSGTAWLPALCPPGSYLLGSSAAVLAIMTVAAMKNPDYPLHLFFIGDVKLKWIACAMIMLAFAGLGGGNSGGVMAHLGGLTAGLLYALYPKLRHTKSSPRPRVSHTRRADMQSAMQQRHYDRTRLDQLLDKIHISGYNSLSDSERAELNELSKKF